MDPNVDKILELYTSGKFAFVGVSRFKKILKSKYSIDVSLPKLQKILDKNDTYQRFRSKGRNNFGSYSDPPSSKHTLACDLVEFLPPPPTMAGKNGMRYAYIFIDIFSRFAYCWLAKSKKASEFIKLWKANFSEEKNRQPCSVLYTDMG